jgi:hypothetical protein
MSIEFPCRFCHAIIRVPDNAGGGKGRCPKCSARIIVPKKSTLKAAARPAAAEQPFVLPDIAPAIAGSAPPPVDPEPVIELEPVVEFETVHPTFDPVAAPAPRIGELPIIQPAKPIARKRKKQKRGNGTTIIVALLILAIIAVSGYLLLPAVVAKRLSGELPSETSRVLELPPAKIEKSRIRLSSDEVAELLKKLEQSPLPMTSNNMQVQLTGTPKGLEVTVAPGAHTQFYRVKPRGNEALQKYLGQHLADLEEQRTKDIDQAVTGFFVAYQQVLARKSTAESMTTFRDALALPSLVGGFGHQVVAAYGRGLYPCVYEDRDGGLYFLLPPGVKEFEMIGRKQSDGRVVVPAEFRVTVQGEVDRPGPSRGKEEKTSQNRTKATDEDPGMDDESSKRKK